MAHGMHQAHSDKHTCRTFVWNTFDLRSRGQVSHRAHPRQGYASAARGRPRRRVTGVVRDAAPVGVGTKNVKKSTRLPPASNKELTAS